METFPLRDTHGHLRELPILDELRVLGVRVDDAYELIRLVCGDGSIQMDQYIVLFVFAVIFPTELLLQINSEGKLFGFHSTNWAWHWFDFVLVVISWFEVVADTMTLNNQNPDMLKHSISGVCVFRVLRIARLFKMIRVLQVTRVMASLKWFVLSLLHTTQVVVWALLLLSINVTVFAMFLTQTVSDYKAALPEQAQADAALNEFWGRLHSSMLILFEISAGGIEWHTTLVPLFRVGCIWVLVFLLYVVMTVFCMLNVTTGVFCESSMAAAKKCQDVTVDEILSDSEAYIRDVKKLF